MHTWHTDPQRARRRKPAQPHQRRRDRCLGELGKTDQLTVGAADDHATARIDHRALGLRQSLGSRGDLLGMACGVRGVVPGNDRRVRPGVIVDVLPPHVHAHVDQHRTGATGLGDVHGLRDDLREVVGLLDQVAVLDDRQGDTDDVGLLEGVRADARRADLPGQRNHRHGVHVGVGDRRDQVRRAGA